MSLRRTAPSSRRVCGENLVRSCLAGGGRLMQSGGRWWLYRSADMRRRPVGHVSPLLVDRLAAEGALLGCDGDRGFIAVPGARVRAADRRVPMPSLPDFVLARAHSPRRTMLEVILTGQCCEPGEAARLRAAANRFAADYEQAATPSPVTMRWDGLPVEARRSGFGSAGPAERAAAAMRRLKQLSRALGNPAMQHVEALVLSQLGPSGFARLVAEPRAGAEAHALEALRALAAAYDLSVTAPR